MPVFGMKPPSYQKFNEFATRDIVLLASEATADGEDGRCDEAPHWSFVVDVTVENSMTSSAAAPASSTIRITARWCCRRCRSTRRSGERYPRGNYCGRGARFGVHSSEENFNNPMYGKLTAIAYFNGGVRIWDIREPQYPDGSGVLRSRSQCQHGPGRLHDQQRRDRQSRLIYIVDRNGAGMDILQLFGCAQQIATGVPVRRVHASTDDRAG